MYQRISQRAKRILDLANEEALRRRHEYIGTEHILAGVVQERDGIGAAVLREYGVGPEKLAEAITQFNRDGERPPALRQLPLTPRARTALQNAVDESRTLGQDVPDSPHVLLGLLRERDGLATHVLKYLGVDADRARAAILKALGAKMELKDIVNQPPQSAAPRAVFPRDAAATTASARSGEAPPNAGIESLIGRRVVLDSAGTLVYLGTLTAVRPDGYWLDDADVHDCRDGHANKELYVCESARDGVRANRQRVFVFRDAVVSVSLLSDVVVD